MWGLGTSCDNTDKGAVWIMDTYDKAGSGLREDL
jgi:hypothetical protein